jgi:hypothetical protein
VSRSGARVGHLLTREADQIQLRPSYALSCNRHAHFLRSQPVRLHTQTHPSHHRFPVLTSSSKRIWPLRAKELLLIGCLGYTMRQRKLQALRDELLDVWSFNLVTGKFDDFEDLRETELVATHTIPCRRRMPT